MKRLSLLFLLFSLCLSYVHAQEPDLSQYADYDLFAHEEPLELELKFDYKNFIRSKYKDEYQNALLTVKIDDNLSVTDTIRIKARGEFRRRYCSFPPVRMNFKKADFPIPALDSLRKVKLVSHCKNSDINEQYLIKEYLAYKTYNLLTDKSFRVRLVAITYVDTEGRKKPFKRYGFVIEEVKKLAKRNECFEVETKGIHPELTQREQMTLIALYQYMIGNTDWHIPTNHNVKLIKPLDIMEDEIYVVPYDFDYSGLVNTVYAIPDEKLGIKSVTERIYLGFERESAELQAAINILLANKAAILALYENCTYLEERHQRECISYLNEFYRIIENPKRVKNEIENYALKP